MTRHFYSLGFEPSTTAEGTLAPLALPLGACVCVCVHAYVSACVRACVRICVYICVCMRARSFMHPCESMCMREHECTENISRDM